MNDMLVHCAVGARLRARIMGRDARTTPRHNSVAAVQHIRQPLDGPVQA